MEIKLFVGGGDHAAVRASARLGGGGMIGLALVRVVRNQIRWSTPRGVSCLAFWLNRFTIYDLVTDQDQPGNETCADQTAPKLHGKPSCTR